MRECVGECHGARFNNIIKRSVAGDDAPLNVFPTLMGTPRYRKTMIGEEYNCYIGDDAQNRYVYL